MTELICGHEVVTEFKEDHFYLPVKKKQKMQTDPLDLSMKTLTKTEQRDSDDGDSELMIVCDDEHHPVVDVRDDNKISKSKGGLVCLLCNLDCKSSVALQKHVNRMHSVKTGDGRVRCAVCGGCFEDVEELRGHQAKSHSDKADKKLAFYGCNHCKKQFRSEKQLAAHRRLLDKKNSWKEGVGKHVSQKSKSRNKKSFN